eukprot:s5613_g3.t1
MDAIASGGGLSLGQSSFQPPSRAAAPMINKIAGIPVPAARPTASSTAAPSTNPMPVAVTQATLESWGKRTASWGKKHVGKQYVEIFNTDPGYTKWVTARIDSLSDEIKDYGNYAITRQHLAQAAMRQVTG